MTKSVIVEKNANKKTLAKLFSTRAIFYIVSIGSTPLIAFAPQGKPVAVPL